MHRYIAFLRAINVGGRNVTMETLRAHFAALGFAGVESFIASGNIIFETEGTDRARLEGEIERHLERELGYRVATFLRTAAEVAAVASYRPFTIRAGGDAHALTVAFLKQPPGEAARERMMAMRSVLDDFHLHGRELYWLCRGKVSTSTFSGAVLERALGMPVTLRNLTTVRKLAARHGPHGVNEATVPRNDASATT
jgi:uncharacterized protein (DUF1697 family)